jgi:hypothetical protein
LCPGRVLICPGVSGFTGGFWQHINLIGTYEFNNDDKVVNLQEVIEKLMSNSEIDLCSAA